MAETSDPVQKGAEVLEDEIQQTTATDGMQAPFDDVKDDDGKDSSHELDTTDSFDKFRKSAQIFLNIHRAEIAERDAEIVRLKAELGRVREGLKALKERQNVAVRDDMPGDSTVPTESAGSKEVADVNRAGHDLGTRLDKFMVDLGEDEASDAYQKIQGIWESCFQVVKHAMERDMSDEILAEWNVYWPDFEERIPNISAVTFEASNSSTAKRTRSMFVMALLAKSLEEYIFSPTYLLEDDDDLRDMLAKMSDTDKKTCLRRMLLSISDDDGRREAVKTTRVERAVEETTRPVRSLLPPEILDQLKSDLAQVIGKAATAWEPLQRCQSHYEVNTTATRARWTWNAVEFVGNGEDTALVTVDSSAFDSDEVLMVLFPRVCAIDRSKKPSFTPVFPGIVLQKSQLQRWHTTNDSPVEPDTTTVVPGTSPEAVEPVTNVAPTTVDNPEIEVVTAAAEEHKHEKQPGDDTATGESDAESESGDGADTGSETEDDTDSGTETEDDQEQSQTEEEDDHDQSKAETKEEGEKGKDDHDHDQSKAETQGKGEKGDDDIKIDGLSVGTGGV
ncbi:hypothetical protein A1O3_05714 [Capronia epimyces CBS 606.96]|uniref:Uncharacterized protein n=1 Tax=Capronia epimyces CBS 606.96 TaxID=1182542 RepID=W9YRY4_9EURO|nr:uncharacterized protein A1O3_05714 [Capronia epimyces CBS 606.96]EXJ85039.1 hypothetical protein A1O3_05714 [Capronia epimyces CBS 606.96]